MAVRAGSSPARASTIAVAAPITTRRTVRAAIRIFIGIQFSRTARPPQHSFALGPRPNRYELMFWYQSALDGSAAAPALLRGRRRGAALRPRCRAPADRAAAAEPADEGARARARGRAAGAHHAARRA